MSDVRVQQGRYAEAKLSQLSADEQVVIRNQARLITRRVKKLSFTGALELLLCLGTHLNKKDREKEL